MRKISTAIVALATLALAAPASAGEIWLNGWSPTSSTSASDRYFSDGTVNVRVSAWSIDDGGIIQDAPLGIWDYGLGVQNGSGDNSHTVDNKGWNDFLLFQFDQTVELDTAMFVSGWHDMYDTDATIGYASLPIAYTTPLGLDGAPESILAGANLYQSNDSSGFQYAPDFNTRGINPGNNVGNFWLIGASFDNPDRYYDGFKLKKLTYTVAPPPPSVPEPGTWLLMILGFGLVGGVMRREKRKGAPALA